jgi:hypothetical protein
LHPFLHNRVHRGVFTRVAGCRFLRVPQEMKGLGSPATCEAGVKHPSTAYPSLSQIFGKQLFTGFHLCEGRRHGWFCSLWRGTPPFPLEDVFHMKGRLLKVFPERTCIFYYIFLYFFI